MRIPSLLLSFVLAASLACAQKHLVLVDQDGSVVFEGPRFPGTMRGTGCLLTCGIAAALANGQTVRDAVTAGRALVRARFESGTIEIGGMRLAY